MVKTKIKKEEEEFEAIEPENTIDTKIELLKFIATVQSRIKKDINEDFTLAKLSDKDKKGIIEMTCNAYRAKRLIQLLGIKSKPRQEYNSITKKWEVTEKTKKEHNERREYINEIAEATFDNFMSRVYMTVILNRNLAGNPLLEILSGKDQAIDGEEEGEKIELKDAIKKLAKEDKGKEE